MYKVSALYDAAEERTLAWDDEDIGVKWPLENPVLSTRDRNGESLAAYRARLLK
jgi:dTDP-4-dehydrorhamnose 3,5-epimerase